MNGDSMDCDNKILAAQLREACIVKPNNVGLPSDIKFNQYGDAIRMRLCSKCVSSPMQSDAACFEGWALALKRWLGIKDIEIEWEYEGDDDEKYQQFLFRVHKFKGLCNWFHVHEHNEKNHLPNLRMIGLKDLFVTSAKGDRDTRECVKCDSLDEALLDENKLECFIRDNADPFLAHFGIRQLYRQLPVGLFHGKVSRSTRVFPGAKSAIDLWGANVSGEFILFELKKAKQPTMGIIPELLYYTHMVEGIQGGHFTLQDTNEVIRATRSIRSYILAPDWHPLIDPVLINVINAGFSAIGSSISCGAVRIIRKPPYGYDLQQVV